jgi:two-component system response regulator FixJ
VTSPSKDNKRKPTVYIVDDDDGMRRALSVLMTTVGFEPTAFARPDEFLAKFDPNRPAWCSTCACRA